MVKIAQKLKPLFKKYPIITVYLFGSRVKSRAGKLSDYDFAFQLDDKIKESKFFDYQIKLNSELMKILKLPIGTIDVVILNNDKAPLLLKYNILKEGKIIYCKNKRKRVIMETKAMVRWLDWQYFENLWGEIFSKRVAEGKI